MVYIFRRAQKKCTEFFIYVNTQQKTGIDKSSNERWKNMDKVKNKKKKELVSIKCETV